MQENFYPNLKGIILNLFPSGKKSAQSQKNEVKKNPGFMENHGKLYIIYIFESYYNKHKCSPGVTVKRRLRGYSKST